jgi:hypothetical protein
MIIISLAVYITEVVHIQYTSRLLRIFKISQCTIVILLAVMFGLRLSVADLAKLI